jgi:uncharacterized repeat protein (TIGR01451 family)
VLTLDKRGPATLRLGQPLVYEIFVRNTGAVPARQVHIQDEVPAGTRFISAEPVATIQGERLTWVLDSLAPGAEQRLKVTVQPAGEGEWAATASVFLSSSSTLRTRIVRPDVAISLGGPASAAVGQAVTFQIRVTNNGNQPLTGLVLRDQLPPGLKHAAGPELEADLGPLAPGKTKDVALNTTAVQPGIQTNVAYVTTGDGQQAEARATVNVAPAAAPLRK